MTTASKQVPAKSPEYATAFAPQPKAPRLWPALLLIVGYWIGYAVTRISAVPPMTQFMYSFWAPLIVAALLIVWWLLLSRMAWLDRVWGIIWLSVGGLAAYALAHKTIATPPVPIFLLVWALPIALTAVVVWLVVRGGAPTWPVRLGVVAASVLAWGYFTLLRVDGLDGTFAVERYWRWEPTEESKFLAELTTVSHQPANAAAAAAAPDDAGAGEATSNGASSALALPSEAAATDWPQFRGAARDSVLRGVSIDPDWKAHPPRELWRRRVGPGWSSFATIGDVAFTQEQRGQDEAVVCFDIPTGKEHWSHVEPARFEEVVAGAGPRATPTFVSGRLFTQGASGKLNCLDATTGDVIWTRDIREDAGLEAPPMWGFSSSPLVTHGAVITFAGGKDGKSVLAYDAATGEPKWQGGKGTHGYASPQLHTAGGVDQVLMVSDHGLQALDPETGQ
ncbi:MAG: PQQ-binding-like beta-propeller repeat protein, partial [Planctomycetaceae bacterium]|nr:PQQ-binding-like beta-propeller repeat protein [Planctomycetaceae bacterium]